MRGKPLSICTGGKSHEPLMFTGIRCPLCLEKEKNASLLKQMATMCSNCQKGKKHGE